MNANGQIFIQQNISLSIWDLAFQTWVTATASWTNYGPGHPGTNGIPSLTSSANPVLGTTPNVLVGSSANTPVLGGLVFGFQRDNTPTAFGGTALVQVAASVIVTVPAAGLPYAFSVPNNTAFCGVTIDIQSALFDGGASHGISFSPGLEYVLGN